MPTLDEQIAQSLAESLRSGELAASPLWGTPLDLVDGYTQTPEELRMAYKALKDAGFVPPEVETMQQLAAMRAELAAMTAGAGHDADAALALRHRIADLQQHLALRLEKLRTSASL
jgi:Domain of unknown function (DUF1992)